MIIIGIIIAYATLCLAHLGLQMILAQVHHFRMQRSQPVDGEELRARRLSVLYPVYNESPSVLRLVLERAQACLDLPNIEIIFVDDGSPNRSELLPLYEEFRSDRLRILFQDNKGKREAQYTGLLVARGEFIITVDSDTLIDPDGLLRLITPLVQDERIGAVCGDVRVQNASVNLLTRLISCRYWTAFNLERAAQSCFRCVLCCSGPLSAYRAEVLHRVREDYIGQQFFGRRCTYGDDRHLTNLVLADGSDVVYQPEAIGWTWVPETLGEYMTQQNRWNKSFYREILWTLRIADRIPPYVLIDMLLQPLLFLGFTLALSFSLLLLVTTWDFKIVAYYLTTVAMMASTRTLYGLLRKRDWRFVVFVLYGFLHVFVLTPVRFKSLWTLTDNHWGTRARKRSSPWVDFIVWTTAYTALLTLLVAGMQWAAPPAGGFDSAGWRIEFTGSVQEWGWRVLASAGYSLALIMVAVVALLLWSRRQLRRFLAPQVASATLKRESTDAA